MTGDGRSAFCFHLSRGRAAHQGLAPGGGAALLAEQSRSGGGRRPREPGRLWGTRESRPQPGSTRRHRPLSDRARERRDPAGPVGQAGRSARHSSARPPGSHRQFPVGARVGDMGSLLGTRSGRFDHVRPDDGRLVDLHRHTGHPAGHLSNLCCDCRTALRRIVGRHDHPHRRSRRDGGCPAFGGDSQRWSRDRRRYRSFPAAAKARDRIPRRPCHRSRRCVSTGCIRPGFTTGAFDRLGRQRC